MTLETRVSTYRLPLEYPFTISRGTTAEAPVVVVEIEDEDGVVGVGGSGPSAHYGETIDTVEAVLPELLAVVEEIGDPHQIHLIEHRMRETVGRNPAARAAVSIALYDLVAKRVDLPLYRYLGLDPSAGLETAYTIGIAALDEIAAKTETALARGYGTLKVKIGTDRDDEILETIRSVAPDVTLVVDANEAYRPREALQTIERLAAFDLEFVEQPVPADNPAGLQYVYDRSPVPIVADESCVTVEDVPAVAERCDMVNLKLMKCGGISEAIRIIHTARANGLGVMCGCMIESNASIAAACHLTPLLDFADLDGSLLLSTDPYDGVPMDGSNIDLETLDRSGTGAKAE